MSTIHYNADEVFQMAEQIERNGAIFYERAAGMVSDPDAKKLLSDFAKWELQHEKTFAALREQFKTYQDVTVELDDMDDVVGAYLRSIADGYVFDVREIPEDVLAGDETLEEILVLAIDAEKNSIVFYVGIQQDTPAGQGRDKIDRIIREEMSHVSALSKALAKITI